MAYLVKPFTKSDLVPAIEMAVSRFAEIAMLEAEVADLRERLETRKAVDRAKGVLQKELGLSEPDAFRWIQKTAMDLRLSMRQVADGVVAHGVAEPVACPGVPGARPAATAAPRSQFSVLRQFVCRRPQSGAALGASFAATHDRVGG